jgi:hypothetical protein
MMTEQTTNEIRSRPRASCPLCDNAGSEMYAGLTDRLFGATGRWNFKRYVNPGCGLWWLDPVPLMEDLPKACERDSTPVDSSSSANLRARLTCASDPNSGEERVLHARKP